MGIYVEWKLSDTENVKICVQSGARSKFMHTLPYKFSSSIYFSLMCNHIRDVTFLCLRKEREKDVIIAAHHKNPTMIIMTKRHILWHSNQNAVGFEWNQKQNEISTNPLKTLSYLPYHASLALNREINFLDIEVFAKVSRSEYLWRCCMDNSLICVYMKIFKVLPYIN